MGLLWGFEGISECELLAPSLAHAKSLICVCYCYHMCVLFSLDFSVGFPSQVEEGGNSYLRIGH